MGDFCLRSSIAAFSFAFFSLHLDFYLFLVIFCLFVFYWQIFVFAFSLCWQIFANSGRVGQPRFADLWTHFCLLPHSLTPPPSSGQKMRKRKLGFVFLDLLTSSDGKHSFAFSTFLHHLFCEKKNKRKHEMLSDVSFHFYGCTVMWLHSVSACVQQLQS